MITRYSDYTRSNVIDNVDRLVKRLRYATPYPIEGDNYQLYCNLISPRIMAAVSVLAAQPDTRGFLEYGSSGDIRVRLPDSNDELSIVFNFRKSLPVCEMNYRKNPKPLYAYQDSPHLRAACAWAAKARDVEKELDNVSAFCRHVIRYCNTPGQLVRVIPAIAPIVMSEDERERVAEMKRKAPFPKGIVRDEAFFERRRMASDILTRCLLMPDTKISTPDIWIN